MPSSGSKLAVFIGNCIAEAVAEGMSTVPPDCLKTMAIPLHLKQMDDPGVRDLIARADFLVVQQIAEVQIGQINTWRAANSELIRMPDLAMRCLWPFDGYSGFHDEAVARQEPSADKHHYDGALAALRSIEPNRGRRFERYLRLKFDLASRIDRAMKAQVRFLEDMDRINDANTGLFIVQNFRSTQLFYNSTHPTEALYEHLCTYFWKRFGFLNRVPTFKVMDGWRPHSVPIHPLIAKGLEFTWVEEGTRYQFGWRGWRGWLTWEEWAQNYIETYG